MLHPAAALAALFPSVLCTVAVGLALPTSVVGQDPPAKASALDCAKELAAKKFAGFTYVGKKAAKNTIDEQGFVIAVIEELASRSKKKVDAKTKAAVTDTIRMKGQSRKAIQAAFAKPGKGGGKVDGSADALAWTRGVQKALVDAGLGTAVDRKDARPGDFVQWWFQYKSGNWGTHVGIIESVSKDRVVIYGAHKTTLKAEKKTKTKKRKGGIGTGPSFSLSKPDKKIFIARFRD